MGNIKQTHLFCMYENLSVNIMHTNKNSKPGHFLKFDNEHPNGSSNNHPTFEQLANVIGTTPDILLKRQDDLS